MPLYIAAFRPPAITAITGNVAKRTKASVHPYQKAKAKPAANATRDIKIFPILSPSPL